MQPAEMEGWSRLREELLAAVRKGEETPLRRFYDGHFAEVYRYVLCRVDGNHTEAEELAADVFFQAFRDMESYDGKRDPEAWLRGIARHRVLDFYRRQRRRPVVELVFSRFDEEFTKKLFDLEAAELPEAELERSELARVVELVLSELPGDYEQVLRLHYVEERPVKEMAEILATTPKAAEARLWRARAAFCAAFRLAGRNLDFNPDGGGSQS
jgi:RNA polymerase sigma-70 factor (ECF subfamily)